MLPEILLFASSLMRNSSDRYFSCWIHSKHLHSCFIIMYHSKSFSFKHFFCWNEIENQITIALFHCKCFIFFKCFVFSLNLIFLKFYLQYQMNVSSIYIAGCYGYEIIIIITLACVFISCVQFINSWRIPQSKKREKWSIFWIKRKSFLSKYLMGKKSCL